jgi:Mesyanzhinovviridae bifunctional DNA primase/polymerase
MRKRVPKLTDDDVLADKLAISSEWGIPGIEPPDEPESIAPSEAEIVRLRFKSLGDEQWPMPSLDELPGGTPKSVKAICQRYVWIRGLKRFADRLDGELLDMAQFDSEFNQWTDRTSFSKELFKTPDLLRRFKSAVFSPGRPELDGVTYNTWRPSPVIPLAGDTSAWDDHVEWLIPDEGDRNKALDWMAWVLQNPTHMPLYALLLVGPQVGTGKSYIARVMEQLIGPANTKRPKNSSLKGQFNPWAWKSRLVLIEELHAIGKREVANELRDVITEPHLEINIKNIPQFTAPSHHAIMGISNHPDALPISKGDRRWLVITVPITPAQKVAAAEAGHFKRIMPMVDPAEPDYRALGAIAAQLLARDVSGFKPGDAPMTEGKAEMIALSNTKLETWLDDNRDNDPFTRRVVSIREDLASHVPTDIQHASGNVETAIRKFIKAELGGVALGDFKVNGRVRKLWAINDWGVEARTQGIEWFKEHRDVGAIYKSLQSAVQVIEETEPWDV